MTVLREGQHAAAHSSSGFADITAKQMARPAGMAPCGTICSPYSAQPGTPCGCKCMMYCAGK